MQVPNPTVITPIKQSEAIPTITLQEDPLVELASQESAAAALAVKQDEAAPTPPPIVNDINLPQQYNKKYSLLKSLIDLHPNIIRSSPNGEIIINNHILVDSSYNDLIRESYIHSFVHNIIGQNQFLQALHVIHADPSLLSNTLVISKYKKLIPKRMSNSNSTQFAAGPPGKRARTIIIYRK